MSNEPTDLREKIKSAITLTPYQRGRVSREAGQVAQYLARREMQAENVLAIVREAQAEAWGRGYDRAVAAHCDAEECDISDHNPYEQETQR